MKRREGESFADYKKRRAEADKELLEYLSERNIWRIVKVTRKEFKKLWRG